MVKTSSGWKFITVWLSIQLVDRIQRKKERVTTHNQSIVQLVDRIQRKKSSN